MKKNKFTYYQNLIRLWLFKAVLLFSVFSFSGYNLQIQSAVTESVQTELIESRTRKSVYRQKKNTNKYSKTLLASLLLNIQSSNIWSILNYNTVLNTKFKSYRNRIVLYSITSTKIRFKIQPTSSEEDTPPLSFC